MKTKPAAATTTTDAAPKPLRMAYHDGPPEIGYCGLAWQRGVAKEVTAHTWETMQARSDFAPFDFRIEPDTPADKE